MRLVERIVGVLPETPAVYPLWKHLVVTHAVLGVQVHDARLVALMTAHGVGHVFTLNPADFQRYPGITAFSPADLLSAPAAPPPP